MRKYLAIMLGLALALGLAACGAPKAEPLPENAPQTEEAPPQFVFTRENFPRLNGSTAMVPLGQAIASVLLGETREEVADLTNFSRTTQSYRELMDGRADLLISGAPPEKIYEEKEDLGFEWEIATFAVDGLVFVVNESNPVDSLTTEQIQKIYSGEITNWSQVGGDDVDIVPFQRNEEAGSQTAMRKLVMGDIPLMEAPAEYVSGAMGDLVKVVASYNDSAAAIGYTVYYYAHDMKMADGLKLLAVDGVEPSAETIRSRAYPFINDSYVVIPAGLPDDAPAKILYDWLLSPEGQKLVAHEGYVSVLDVGDKP
ncbi:MAG: phosphate ABC transporter substrate-binding protein [Ruminococcaceae bacterium]|jgi:phosphate transport system substrate-binding protein|nr:phosphate ABC transporter substrate-binding protein [Oscillospiraceae bacterium]